MTKWQRKWKKFSVSRATSHKPLVYKYFWLGSERNIASVASETIFLSVAARDKSYCLVLTENNFSVNM